jgi:long-chain acyl-CoA synthetase
VNLASLLLEHPFTDAEPLLIGEHATITAGAARAAARALAATITDAGVAPGHAVAVQVANGPDAVVAMVAVWIAGGVFVPLNPRLPDAERAASLATTEPAALVTDDGVSPLPGRRDYDDGTAFVTWTSGTTGRPKAILHTHVAYFELIDRVLAPLRGGAADPTSRPTPNLIPVSLALNAGIYNALFGLRAGAALVIMDRFTTESFARLVREHAIRSTVLPPAAITMLADDDTVTDLAPLRYVRSITAPLSPLAARRFTDKFAVTVLNGYGQAEIGEVIGWTAADAKAHPDKVGAVGKPHPGVDLRLDPASGELLVRPPNRAVGYAGGDSLADRVDADGFVRTGDIAHIDADGFVWIDGRVGDVINRGGNKVFPEQVEEVLRLSPRVREAAVVGVPDRRLGEVPVAFVVGDATTDELETLCRDQLVAYKVPIEFLRVDELPRSEVGKVLRRELQDRHAAEVAEERPS